MKLSSILERKGRAVHSIHPDASLAVAIEMMARENCGSLVVCDHDEMVGIVSERDILRGLAASDQPLGETRVAQRMNHRVVTAEPNDDIADVMGRMTQHRIRHLPVVDDGGRVQGLISIGDLNAHHSNHQEVTIHFLHEYLHGRT